MASSARMRPSSSKPTRQRGVEAVSLAGHRHVLLAAEPEPDRPSRESRAERGHGCEPVGLHLLAAEPAAHPQALHGDPVARHAQHVGGDLLGLGGVLGAGLHEHLAVLVDGGQRAVGLEVEVLLAREVDLALEHVAGPGQAGGHVAALQHRLHALVAAGLDRLDHGHDRGQWFVVDLDPGCSAAGGFQRLAEHPAHGVAVVPGLVREQRLVVLDAPRR